MLEFPLPRDPADRIGLRIEQLLGQKPAVGKHQKREYANEQQQRIAPARRFLRGIPQCLRAAFRFAFQHHRATVLVASMRTTSSSNVMPAAAAAIGTSE